jgi:hypothetical protein
MMELLNEEGNSASMEETSFFYPATQRRWHISFYLFPERSHGTR